MMNSELRFNPKNIEIEDHGTDISDVLMTIRRHHRNGCKVFVIDSMMDMTNRAVTDGKEAKISGIFQALKNITRDLNILVFIIVQTSKGDHKEKNVSVKGSIDADHALAQFWFIDWDTKGPKRTVRFRKNKQDGNHNSIELWLTKDVEFTDVPVAAVEEYVYQEETSFDMPIVV